MQIETQSWLASMPPKLPKYVHEVKARGKTYYYFRKGGAQRPLPNDPESSAFFVAYAAFKARDEAAPTRTPDVPGTVGWMIGQYMASPEFRALAAKTRTSYERELHRLAPVAEFPAADIQRNHIRALAKPLEDRARTRKLFFQVVSLLWNFGVGELDLELVNPAQKMKRIGDVTSYKPWSDDEMAAFEASSPPVHLMTCYMVARYTGPRRGDIAMLMRSHYDGAELAIAGTKTGAPVQVPVHPRLKSYLDSLPAALYLIADAKGRPVSPDRLSKDLRRHLDSIGLHHLHLHGLRHTAAKALAEAGCSAHEIQAVLGHRTLQMVEKYTSRARRGHLAGAAILKLRNRDGT